MGPHEVNKAGVNKIKAVTATTMIREGGARGRIGTMNDARDRDIAVVIFQNCQEMASVVC